MNKTILIGRLATDVSLRRSGEALPIASFTVAVGRVPKRDGTKITDFIRVIVFGKQGEICERFLEKGARVAVDGRIQTGSYTKENGEKVYTTDVAADRVEIIDFREKDDNKVDFEPVIDEIPF